MSSTLYIFREEKAGQAPALHLCRSIQHIFDKDPITHGRIVNEDMGHGTYESAALDNWTAGHE